MLLLNFKKHFRQCNIRTVKTVDFQMIKNCGIMQLLLLEFIISMHVY